MQAVHHKLKITEVSVPLSYMEEVYNLRLHVDFVLQRVRQIQAAVRQQFRTAA